MSKRGFRNPGDQAAGTAQSVMCWPQKDKAPSSISRTNVGSMHGGIQDREAELGRPCLIKQSG